MANRSIQQKMLKIKRRNRHAVFSGETTKYAVRLEDRIEHVNEDTTRLKKISIPVGKISLSKAVINTGRGPDNSRMQEYYARLNSYDEALPKTLGFTGIDCSQSNSLVLKYQEILRDTPKEMRVCLFEDDIARLDLYFNITQWFFVEADFKKVKLRRSITYKNRQMAMAMYDMNSITWVETISPK
jgi:hypothetical protein